MVETNPASGLSYVPGAEDRATDADSGLVSRAGQGDLDAFEQLVAKHQKRMLNIAFRFLGDYDEACEAVQDAFIAAYKNIKTFRGEAKFSTWMTSITLNHARNRLKQMILRRTRMSLSLDDPVEGRDGALLRQVPSKDPSALERLENEAVRTRLTECIQALDTEYREVLILRDMQDFSYEEIASSLRLRQGTVKSRLFRAREAVKDCLEKELEML